MNTCDYKIPRYITIDLTDRCQMECVTCSKWKTRPDDVIAHELTCDEWKNIISKLREKSEDGFTLCFSGGEPFLRNDIFELADYANSLGITTVVVTNGFGLENIYEKIMKSPIRCIHFSLNSINNPAIHDRTRGRKGSFEKIIKALQVLVNYRNQGIRPFSVGVSTIIMPENLEEIIPLVLFVARNRIGSIIFQLVDDIESFHGYFYQQCCNTIDYSMPEMLRNMYQKMKHRATEVIDTLVQMKISGYPISNSFEQFDNMKTFLNNPDDILKYTCNTTSINLALDPYGNVRLCFNMSPIGNLKEKSLDEILSGQLAIDCMEQSKNCTRYCRLLSCNCNQKTGN